MNQWWVSTYYEAFGIAFVLSWILWVLTSISLHELGHGWAAIKQGDDTPIVQDRMTLNPVVHMGPVSLILFFIIGIAFGVMPVNPYRFKDGRRGEAFVAAAGPAVNLVLVIVCAIGAATVIVFGDNLGLSAQFDRNLRNFFNVGCYLNIFLLAFNLLPIPPLDGSVVLASFCRPYERLIKGPEFQNYLMFGMFIAMFALAGPISSFSWSFSQKLILLVGEFYLLF